MRLKYSYDTQYIKRFFLKFPAIVFLLEIWELKAKSITLHIKTFYYEQISGIHASLFPPRLLQSD